MEFKEVFRTLERNRYYVFSLEDLSCFYRSARKASLKQLLYRWRKNGWISSLKRGLYELTYPHSFNIPDMYVANRLYAPSYVSLETALSHYSLIPETAMAVTSVTVKATRTFRNKHGLFAYRTLKRECFTGYRIEAIAGCSVLIAEPEKALVDYLHFKTWRTGKIDLNAERLDMKTAAGLNRNEMNRYARAFGLNLKGLLYAYL